MGRFQDLTEQRFGRWVVVSRDTSKARTYWNCKCDCGKEMSVCACSLTSGKSISCGCFNVEGTVARCLSHGHANGGNGTRTYNCWRNMKARCTNQKNHKWADYGGRGITVCATWITFDGFLADMGECPPNHSIDRIDVNGNYTPDNCRWADPTQQANNQRDNTRLTLRGITKTVSEWARELGIHHTTILQRINRSGWSVEKALTEPVHFGRH